MSDYQGAAALIEAITKAATTAQGLSDPVLTSAQASGAIFEILIGQGLAERPAAEQSQPDAAIVAQAEALTISSLIEAILMLGYVYGGDERLLKMTIGMRSGFPEVLFPSSFGKSNRTVREALGSVLNMVLRDAKERLHTDEVHKARCLITELVCRRAFDEAMAVGGQP